MTEQEQLGDLQDSIAKKYIYRVILFFHQDNPKNHILLFENRKLHTWLELDISELRLLHIAGVSPHISMSRSFVSHFCFLSSQDLHQMAKTFLYLITDSPCIFSLSHLFFFDDSSLVLFTLTLTHVTRTFHHFLTLKW